MRAGFKIVMKLGVIGGFLFCTPFFDGMRQLIEEQRENRRPPDEERDLRAALEDYYERHLSDGTFVSYLAETGGEIIGTSGMSFVEKPPWFGCPS